MQRFRFNKLSISIWFFVLCLPIIASGATAADLQFTAEEQAWLSSNKKIVVGGEKDWAPFDFVERTGEYAGIANDYLKIIGNALGVEIEVITGPTWSELLELARRKEIDLLPAIYHSRVREEFLRFTEPYLILTEFVFTQSNETAVSNFVDLQDKTTVVVKGYKIENVLRSEYPSYNVITAPSIQDALGKIVTGEADAFIGDLVSTSYTINKLTLPGIKPTATVPFKALNVHMAVRKDLKVLQRLIDKVLKIIPEKEKNALKNKWIKHAVARTTDSTSIIDLTAEEQAWLDAHPVIRVQNETTSPPFNFSEHNRPKGFSIDYFRLLAAKIGFETEFIIGPSWDEFLSMMKSGELDLMLNIAKTPEREAYLSYTPPFVTLVQTLFTRDDFPLVTSIEDLYGKRIAVPKGFYIADLLKEYPEIEIVEVRDILESIQAVSSGTADALYDLMPAVNYLMNKHQITNLKAGGELNIEAGRPIQLHLAVSQKEPLFVSILSKGMSLISDEEFQALNNKWLKPQREKNSELNLTIKERIWLEEHPVIRIVNDKSFPPYDFYKGGKSQGFSVDYLELLSDLAGFEIEWMTTDDWDKSVNDVKNKNLDALHGVGMTEERLTYMSFSKPYFKNLTGLFVRWDSEGRSSVKGFAGVTLAVPKGYSDIDHIKTECPDCDILETSNPSAALEAVAHSKAEAAVLDSGVGSYLIAELGLNNLRLSNYLFLGEEGQKDAFMVGVRNDWPELVGILNKAIDSVSQDEMTGLRRQWLLDEVPKPIVEASDQTPYKQILTYGLTALLFLLLLALIVLKFIKAERVSTVFGSKSFRSYVFIGLAVFIMIVIFMGFLALGSIHQKVLSNIDNSLRSGLKMADHALEYWVRDRTYAVRHLGHNSQLLQVTKRLLEVPHTREALLSSEALAGARDFFEKEPSVFNNIGFFIISPDYISLGSKRDANIGTINLIAEQRPDLLQRAFEGEVLFVPPIRSDVPLEKVGTTATTTMPPTMFFIGPIENTVGEIIAVFTLRVDPTKEFAHSLKLAGESYSQETYAFNKNGVLLTNSRFDEQLRKIGLLKKHQSSSLQLMLRDPGVNRMKGKTPAIPSTEQPLTQMAQRAIANRTESKGSKLDLTALRIETDVEGYRDYRGVPVFGAWLWDMNLDVGIAVEIDIDEAMSNYSYVRNILFVILGLTLMLSTGVTVLVLVLGQRTSKLLASAKDTLEDTVNERTAELSAAEEHSRLILSSMGEGLIEVDTEGRATFINASALLMLGFSEEEILGQEIHDMVHHSHADGSHFDKHRCPMNKSFSDGVSHSINDEVLWRKDGTSFPVEYSATPISQNNTVVGAVIVFQDVTKRILADQEIQTSKNQLQNILDTSPIAVAFSTGGIIHFTNPSFEAQFGVKIGDESPNLYAHPSDREEIIAVVQKDGQVTNYEVQMFNKEQEVRDMLVSYVPINYDGEEGILGWLLDITERKEMEAALFKERDRLQEMLNTSPVSTAISVDGVFRFVNKNWIQLTGFKEGDSAAGAYVDPESRLFVIEALKTHGKLENYAVKMYDQNEGIHDMLATYYPFDYEGEKGVLGWVVDVTGLTKIENELRDKFSDLERFRKLAVGREIKMIELKKEINSLIEKDGGTPRYKIH